MRKAVMKARLWVNGMRLRRIYAKGDAYIPTEAEIIVTDISNGIL